MKTQATLTTLLLICAPGLADVTSDVRCREIGFSQSVEEQDMTAFESFLDIDARFVGASINRGPAEIVKAWSVFFSEDGPKITWRPQIVEVLEDGKLALPNDTVAALDLKLGSRIRIVILIEDTVDHELERFCGAWQDDCDADDIIADIYASREGLYS